MRFLFPLLLLPLVEIAGLILIGRAVGVMPTLLLVVLSALLGIRLVRRHGLGSFRRAQARMERGEPLAREIFDGLCLTAAGLLLIVPGPITDAVGLLLSLAPMRTWLFSQVGSMIAGARTGAPPHPGTSGRDVVIDAEWVEVGAREGVMPPAENPRTPQSR